MILQALCDGYTLCKVDDAVRRIEKKRVDLSGWGVYDEKTYRYNEAIKEMEKYIDEACE